MFRSISAHGLHLTGTGTLKNIGDKKKNEDENRDDLTLLDPGRLEYESSSRELIVERKSNSNVCKDMLVKGK